MDFSKRSEIPELLDARNIPAKDIVRNMQELAFINQHLGGHAVTWKGFSSLARKNDACTDICEIGCGGGDNLKTIGNRSRNTYGALHFTGIDINPDCIRVASDTQWSHPAEFIISDYREVIFKKKPGIIFSSLFCHHFKEDELVQMLQWMRQNSTVGFFINDLHRHAAAYYSIHWLTRLFSRSYLVKNDAPLSVMRGFRKKEIQQLMEKAGILQYTLQWKWAFRWLIIVRHD